MPRRKQDALVPLPDEMIKPDESKVDVALNRLKETKKISHIDIEYNDTDDEVEYTIQPVSSVEPVIQVKPKRKYTRKTKTVIEPDIQVRNDTAMLDIQRQLNTLRLENEKLKAEHSLNQIGRLNNMARVMKVKF
jgi:hypothetical protein